ncbi:unnamed protein product [Ectocarpus sp. 12 AP-2014]
MMAPSSATTTRRMLGLAAVALALAATNAATDSYVVDTTGGVSDAGPPSATYYYGSVSDDGCGDGTIPVVDNDTPAPTVSVRCITIDDDYTPRRRPDRRGYDDAADAVRGGGDRRHSHADGDSILRGDRHKRGPGGDGD